MQQSLFFSFNLIHDGAQSDSQPRISPSGLATRHKDKLEPERGFGFLSGKETTETNNAVTKTAGDHFSDERLNLSVI